MSRKKIRREILKRTDHRLDMSPAGRNIFVSRDKEAQHRSARRIKLWMRVVAILAGLLGTAAVLMAAAFLLVPWFRQELTLPGSASGTSQLSSLPSEPEEVLEYDDMGLPVYGDDLNLFVINVSSPADGKFAPELAEACGVQVDSRIVEALGLLSAAAREDGLALVFSEGYVSYAEQEKRFNAKVEELIKTQGLTTVMAKTEAKSLEPAPGECDAQSGLCLRLNSDPATFAKSRTYSWLKANMGKFGFIFRYPEYKEDYTGVKADPTVIRYVGSKTAQALQQRSMCLEEYLDYLASQ